MESHLLPSKEAKGPRRELYYEAKLFAIGGVDAAEGGSTSKNLSNTPTVTLQQVLDWFILRVLIVISVGKRTLGSIKG